MLCATLGDFRYEAVHVTAQGGKDGAQFMNTAPDQPLKETDRLISHRRGHLIAMSPGDALNLALCFLESAPMPTTANLGFAATIHSFAGRRLHEVMTVAAELSCEFCKV